MTNNGPGLVIAAGTLAHIPAVLPIIFYNLMQHVIAGGVDRYWMTAGGGPSGAAGGRT